MSDPKGTAVVTGATGGVGALVLAPLRCRIGRTGYDLLLNSPFEATTRRRARRSSKV